ncbi:bifunctional oligoribonuclease/PAP phosphatase NrnA [Nonlabens ponticola]|uniref:Bifunctional oligoribonuclease/PAP phosphatase NrnA n=2 Tax=Nonlabens ponticola TaxID=2496866 RepID=A0A3S9N1G7_9FLAO|nr:bifunctional oligoribonuclease/PAP phosphatase NrnA [Nonlabens ponticola]
MNEEMIIGVKQLLETPKKIVIVPHKSPDGDAIGSITALYSYLNKLGHETTMISPNDYPKFLSWLDHTDKIINFEKQNSQALTAIDEAQIIFILDHNALHRAGDMEQQLTASDATFVMIDHHQQPDDFARFMYSDTSMSSTCEMVYHFLDQLDALDLIDQGMATSLYTGILTDTGSFKYRSTTSTTLRVAANLVDKGADSEKINRRIYDVNSPSRMKLLGVALSNLIILPEYRAAFITLTQQELDDNNFEKGDTEGFVNYALSLDDIVFAQIFIEKADESMIKTSLRSKGDFDVNKMAREHWNGGGHKNAAGGRSEASMQETVDKLISILPQYESDLKSTII